ncbi:MAG: hypothetical protein FVQ82_09900 [Planctomycetes bacterium]|nr:hypothetical protein [Planctomycetota bacterium]
MQSVTNLVKTTKNRKVCLALSMVVLSLMIIPLSLVLAQNNAVNTSESMATENKQVEDTGHTSDDQEHSLGETLSGNGASPDEKPERIFIRQLENRDYYLASGIALFTALAVALLIILAYKVDHDHSMEKQSNALHLVVVALIIEGLLIAGILHVEISQFEAIYAAIAGYVLGSNRMGQHNRPVADGANNAGGNDKVG